MAEDMDEDEVDVDLLFLTTEDNINSSRDNGVEMAPPTRRPPSEGEFPEEFRLVLSNMQKVCLQFYKDHGLDEIQVQRLVVMMQYWWDFGLVALNNILVAKYGEGISTADFVIADDDIHLTICSAVERSRDVLHPTVPTENPKEHLFVKSEVSRVPRVNEGRFLRKIGFVRSCVRQSEEAGQRRRDKKRANRKRSIPDSNGSHTTHQPLDSQGSHSTHGQPTPRERGRPRGRRHPRHKGSFSSSGTHTTHKNLRGNEERRHGNRNRNGNREKQRRAYDEEHHQRKARRPSHYLEGSEGQNVSSPARVPPPVRYNTNVEERPRRPQKGSRVGAMLTPVFEEVREEYPEEKGNEVQGRRRRKGSKLPPRQPPGLNEMNGEGLKGNEQVRRPRRERKRSKFGGRPSAEGDETNGRWREGGEEQVKRPRRARKGSKLAGKSEPMLGEANGEMFNRSERHLEYQAANDEKPRRRRKGPKRTRRQRQKHLRDSRVQKPGSEEVAREMYQDEELMQSFGNMQIGHHVKEI